MPWPDASHTKSTTKGEFTSCGGKTPFSSFRSPIRSVFQAFHRPAQARAWRFGRSVFTHTYATRILAPNDSVVAQVHITESGFFVFWRQGKVAVAADELAACS
jgi:hypothetical protein